jgi:hypothetical protein
MYSQFIRRQRNFVRAIEAKRPPHEAGTSNVAPGILPEFGLSELIYTLSRDLSIRKILLNVSCNIHLFSIPFYFIIFLSSYFT